MTNELTLVEDKGKTLVYKVPSSVMNLIDQEQLEELKKPAPLFFDCENYVVNPDSIQFYYKKEDNFQPIEVYRNKDKELMKSIALQLLQMENLIGTQYTTIIHPKNIFIKSDGTVKLAHRGIRNVFPNQTMTTAKLVTDLRKIFIYLFSDIPYENIEEDTYHLAEESLLLAEFRQSKTLDALRNIVENYPSFETRESTVKQKKVQKNPIENKNMKNNPIQRLSPLAALLSGLIIGMVLIYLIQVVPANHSSANEIAAAENEMTNMNEENTLLKQQLTEHEALLSAYRSASQDELAEAVAVLEEMEELEAQDEQFLFNLYIEQNSVESLSKGLELGESYELPAIQALGSLETDEAQQVIATWETELEEVLIEQAYINTDYERVIELSQTIEDNRRAKMLAAYSYIEMEQPEKALELGKELDNTRIQIDSLLKENKLLPENKDLDDEEKEAREEEIQKELEKLRKE